MQQVKLSKQSPLNTNKQLRTLRPILKSLLEEDNPDLDVLVDKILDEVHSVIKTSRPAFKASERRNPYEDSYKSKRSAKSRSELVLKMAKKLVRKQAKKVLKSFYSIFGI